MSKDDEGFTSDKRKKKKRKLKEEISIEEANENSGKLKPKKKKTEKLRESVLIQTEEGQKKKEHSKSATTFKEEYTESDLSEQTTEVTGMKNNSQQSSGVEQKKKQRLKQKRKITESFSTNEGELISQNKDNLSVGKPVKKKKKGASKELCSSDSLDSETNHDLKRTKKSKGDKKRKKKVVSDNVPLGKEQGDKNDGIQKRKKLKHQQHIKGDDLSPGQDNDVNAASDRGEGQTKKTPKKKKDKTKKTKEISGDTDEESSICAKTAAIDYLKAWSEDRSNWKFKKVRQVWLLQHLYDDSKVSDEDFTVLLLYLENLKGKAKEETMTKATKVLEDEETPDDDQGEKLQQRAREILQMLN